MSDMPAARWVARAWAVLVVTSACYFLADNEADNDLWMHIFSGRLVLTTGAVPRLDDLSYTAAGQPWIDHEWLTQAAFAALFDGLGAPALWLAKLALAVLTAWLVWVPLSRRSTSAWVRGPVMVLVLATLARGYAIRPQIVTYLGVAALLALLDHLDRRRTPPARWLILVLIGACFALWANAHGGFIVGLGILALYAAIPPGGAPTGPSLSLRALMLAAATVAAALNAYGPSLFGYILDELRAPHPLTEWQPVEIGDPAQIPFLVSLAVLIATLPFTRMLRRQRWWGALLVIVAVMACRNQRHIPLFALCAGAPLAEQLDTALARLRQRTSFQLSDAALTIVALGLIGVGLAQVGLLADRIWNASGGIVYDAADYPVGALRFAREHELRGNLALPLDWGGYALWHGAPAMRVSLDGRFATVYPPRVVEDNFAFFRGDNGPDAGRLLDAYDTTLVLVPRTVSTPLSHRPGWQLLYSDTVAALFGKSGTRASGNAEAPRGWLPFP